jgi:hypothetical protein
MFGVQPYLPQGRRLLRSRLWSKNFSGVSSVLKCIDTPYHPYSLCFFLWRLAVELLLYYPGTFPLIAEKGNISLIEQHHTSLGCNQSDAHIHSTLDQKPYRTALIVLCLTRPTLPVGTQLPVFHIFSHIRIDHLVPYPSSNIFFAILEPYHAKLPEGSSRNESGISMAL